MANGALGAFSAWLDNNKRVARRQLGDLMNNPDDFGRMQAARFREDQQKYMEDPASGLDFVGGPLGALAGVIKNKGGNWLTGSVEKALSGLRTNPTAADSLRQMRELYTPEAVERLAPNLQQQVNRGYNELIKQESINNWIEGPLTKYIKTQMATPEDPVRALAEQGILHFRPNWIPEADFARRQADSFVRTPELNSPGSRLGKSQLAQNWEDITDQGVDLMRAGDIRGQALSENPWIAKIDQNSPVHGLPNGMESVAGFDHLTDELRNALNPESGLPRSLLLRPEQLKQMGMEKAVRHVDSINKWRAAQKIAADQELASKASVLREYTENNPKGLRWVELGKDTPDLEKQLKYEGDTMGHCVGGYCDDVIEGRSRIFSLRDAKGEPHVTVEVAPPGQGANAWAAEGEELSPFASIIQIKGKQNKAPNTEYLPFVQDFVKNSPLNSPWADVGDFENTRLVRRGNVFSPTEKQGLIDLGADVPEYLTTEDIRALRKLRGDEGFSEGGLVNNPFGDVTPKAMLNRIIDVYNQL